MRSEWKSAGVLGILLTKETDSAGAVFTLLSCLEHECDGRTYSGHLMSMRKSHSKCRDVELLSPCQQLPAFLPFEKICLILCKPQ